jgi:MYXO-CTERM domain-containing protein
MNRFLASVGVGLIALSASLLAPRDAGACGGCFHGIQQGESTQVTGHRMIFSVSQSSTTLWDQIAYSGSPQDFAWVLPIHGKVDVGLSSDALFGELEQLTRVQIQSPSIYCPPPPSCGYHGNTGGGGPGGYGGTGGASGTTSDPVTVLAQETVGPFETVQLSSQDPAALTSWLTMHDYAIPDDVKPIIAAYVGEGFDFLALKLVPGQDVHAMQPVRVTTPGAGLALPLRMVAAGTGMTTPITLWVASEGRYEPSNFPAFVIKPDDIVWDWDTQSSNYKELRQAGFDATNGKGWLIETAGAHPTDFISTPLMSAAQYAPKSSGYGDDPSAAQAACAQDMKALFGSLDPSSFWITRLHAELPRSALDKDLQLGASADQSAVSQFFVASKTTGTAPSCPPPPSCGNGDGGVGDYGGYNPNAGAGGSGSSGHHGCSVGGSESSAATVLAVLGLAAMLHRKRREKR